MRVYTPGGQRNGAGEQVDHDLDGVNEISAALARSSTHPPAICTGRVLGSRPRDASHSFR